MKRENTFWAECSIKFFLPQSNSNHPLLVHNGEKPFDPFISVDADKTQA